MSEVIGRLQAAQLVPVIITPVLGEWYRFQDLLKAVGVEALQEFSSRLRPHRGLHLLGSFVAFALLGMITARQPVVAGWANCRDPNKPGDAACRRPALPTQRGHLRFPPNYQATTSCSQSSKWLEGGTGRPEPLLGLRRSPRQGLDGPRRSSVGTRWLSTDSPAALFSGR